MVVPRPMMMYGLARSGLTSGCVRLLQGRHLPCLSGLLEPACELAEKSAAISTLLRGLLQTIGELARHLFEFCRVLLLQLLELAHQFAKWRDVRLGSRAG